MRALRVMLFPSAWLANYRRSQAAQEKLCGLNQRLLRPRSGGSRPRGPRMIEARARQCRFAVCASDRLSSLRWSPTNTDAYHGTALECPGTSSTVISTSANEALGP